MDTRWKSAVEPSRSPCGYLFVPSGEVNIGFVVPVLLTSTPRRPKTASAFSARFETEGSRVTLLGTQRVLMKGLIDLIFWDMVSRSWGERQRG